MTLLSGCMLSAKSADHNHPPQSFANYAEEVFRRQNHATSQVMMLSVDELDDKDALEELLSAEKSMHNACEDLNAYAESQNDANTSLLLRARAAKSIEQCNLATKTLETLLEDLDLAAVTSKPPSP
ncbi:MAG: hypothetical protein HOP02_09650 [Methylococcaceae bacterium]|nr:hypothetical protein [Methylococcaceae bacterium]